MAEPPGALPVTVRVARSVDDLDELSEAWQAFGPGVRQPMLSHAWVRACAAAFAGPGQLAVTVVDTLDDAVAMAPLVVRGDTIPQLELLGVDEIGEPSDLFAVTPSALGWLADALVRTGRPLHLKRILAESPTVAALRRAYRGRGLVIALPHAAYPWISLDGGWTCPESRLSARRRSDVRRARRIAERLGSVTSEVIAPEAGEVKRLLGEALKVEAASWKGARGSALLVDPGRRVFFNRYALAAAEQGILRLAFLRIGGRAAAMQLAVESGRRFWLLKIGYDASFSRCSPGTLLMIETLRYAAQRGLHSYEFLGTVEPWTSMWNPRTRPCVSLRAYPATPAGMAALIVELGRITRRKLGGLGRFTAGGQWMCR